MRYNVVKHQTKFGRNCSFILTRNFFRNSVITFVQLLRPHQLASFQKSFRKDLERNAGVIFCPNVPKIEVEIGVKWKFSLEIPLLSVTSLI